MNTDAFSRLLMSVYSVAAMVASGVLPLQRTRSRARASLAISPVVISRRSMRSTSTAAAL